MVRVRFLAHVEVPSLGRCFDLLCLRFLAPLNDPESRGSGEPTSECSLFCAMIKRPGILAVLVRE